jgi:hypothetical protein
MAGAGLRRKPSTNKEAEVEETIGYEAFFSPDEWEAIETGDYSAFEEGAELEFSEVAPDGTRAQSSHGVTIYYPPGQYAGNEHAYEIECEACGDVGVADTLEQAQAIARLHEEFVAVVVDATEVPE